MDSLETTRTTISHLFSSGHSTSPEEFLANLEDSTGWFFIMDTSGNISKFETLKQLKAFAAMAIADIRSTYPVGIKPRFLKLYRMSPKTLRILEEDFPELGGFNVSAPAGNPRFWRLKFQDNSDRICTLLAHDRTNYGKLILPHTEDDLSEAARTKVGYLTQPASLVWRQDKDLQRLLAARAYMDKYLGAHRDRWMKFFGYLHSEKKVELLQIWYPDS